MRGLPGAALTAFLAVGCGASEAASAQPGRLSCQASSTPSVHIHQGTAPHDTIETGDLVDVEYGSQGGMHVLLSVSCAGLDPGSATLEQGLANDDLPRVTWSVSVPTDQLSQETPRRAVRQEELGDRTLLEPQLVVLRYFESAPAEFDVSGREYELEQMSATVSVGVEDRCDRSASATTEVHLRFPRDGG